MTDRQTDHATQSVTIDRIYVHSTAMRSKNSTYRAELSKFGWMASSLLKCDELAV